VLECVNADEKGVGERKRMIGRMVDVYDRVLLVLRYSVQFIDDIADKLEHGSKRNDRVGITGTTSGLFSGIAGVAAAATILTPAGPPLLIASLLFGGTAQVFHTGTKTVNYYSTPRRLAARIIAYYNLCKSVLFVTCVLRDALLKDQLNLENYVETIVKGVEEMKMKGDYGYGGLETDVGDDDDDETTVYDTLGEDVSVSGDSMLSADTSSVVSSIQMTSFDEKIFDMGPGLTPRTPNRNSGCDIKSSYSADDLLMSPRSNDALISPTNTTSPRSPEALLPKSFFIDDTTLSDIPLSAPEAFDVVCDLDQQHTNDNHYTNAAQTTENDNDNDVKQEDGAPSSETKEEDGIVIHVSPKGDSKTGASARFFSRTSLASSGLAGAASVAAMAGGALSVIHIAFEAKSFANTFKRMQKGSPCAKAATLKAIKEEYVNFPSTAIVAQEWDKNLTALANRKEKMGMIEETTHKYEI